MHCSAIFLFSNIFCVAEFSILERQDLSLGADELKRIYEKKNKYMASEMMEFK